MSQIVSPTLEEVIFPETAKVLRIKHRNLIAANQRNESYKFPGKSQHKYYLNFAEWLKYIENFFGLWSMAWSMAMNNARC